MERVTVHCTEMKDFPTGINSGTVQNPGDVISFEFAVFQWKFVFHAIRANVGKLLWSTKYGRHFFWRKVIYCSLKWYYWSKKHQFENKFWWIAWRRLDKPATSSSFNYGLYGPQNNQFRRYVRHSRDEPIYGYSCHNIHDHIHPYVRHSRDGHYNVLLLREDHHKAHIDRHILFFHREDYHAFHVDFHDICHRMP